MVFVLTYNTADKPDRRIVRGVYSTETKALAALKNIKKTLGDFLVDYEINAKELDA